jgi:uncharacterized protein YbjQ (UPF0145 family)
MSNQSLATSGHAQPYPLAPIHDASATLVTTANGIDGFRVAQNLGIVRGIVVRSRSVVGNFVAGIQMIFGGNISIYAELCEQARQDAFRIMVDHARALHANAIIAMRYDATEIGQGVTEVLAYGTAVRVEPDQGGTPHR